MKAIFEHEIKTYFQSLSAYVFGAFLLFFTGVFLMIYNLQAAVSNFEYVLGALCLIFIIIVPILTMRVIAEERKQKTDQLLYSLPLNIMEIVIGKYLALFVVFFIPMLAVCIYPLILAQFGNVYLPISYGTIFAFLLLGAALIAIGMFISSLTESQPVAAGLCFVVMIINYYLSSISEYFSTSAFASFVIILLLILLFTWIMANITKNTSISMLIAFLLIIVTTILFLFFQDYFATILSTIISKISLFERFDVFVYGTFDMTGVVYYLSIVVFFVFLTVQSMEKRRYN